VIFPIIIICVFVLKIIIYVFNFEMIICVKVKIYFLEISFLNLFLPRRLLLYIFTDYFRQNIFRIIQEYSQNQITFSENVKNILIIK
jgi:hypothetical protein